MKFTIEGDFVNNAVSPSCEPVDESRPAVGPRKFPSKIKIFF